MKAVLKHELSGYFHSLTAYVFGAFLLVFVGIGSMLYNIQQAVANFEYVLGFISLIFVGLVPILTMRVLAEERKQRTDQLLYSLPITTTDIILGKYLALLVVFLIPLVIVAFYPLIFAKFGDVYLLTSYGSLIAFFIMGAALTLLFLLFAVIMFVLEKIPLGVTSMIVCCGLVVTRVLDVKTAFAGFIDSNVILFVAMFIVGGALFETGMANKIGGIVTKFASSERTLIVAIMVIVGVMSGVLSNTGTAAVLIPVVIGIAAKSGYSRSRLLMPLVFAAAMGGNLSLIGAPGNLIAQSELQKNGLSFGFFEYAIVGVPILICGILFYATIGHRLLPDREPTDDGAFDTTKNFDDVPKWKQIVSLVVLVLTLLGMIFEEQIGIKLCVTGCIGALVLILTGVISEKDALKSIDLKTIFLFGGTLSLASALGETGAGEMIAGKVIAMLGDNPSPYVLTFVVFVLCCLLTNFMSNTATTALMAPICMSIAQGMGADPRAVLMACVIGGSCAYATPIGMPANTMVVGAGGYTFMDYVKAGFPLIIIATVVSMIILPIAFPFFP